MVSREELAKCAALVSTLDSVTSADVVPTAEADTPQLEIVIASFDVPPTVSKMLGEFGVRVLPGESGTRGDPTTAVLVGR